MYFSQDGLQNYLVSVPSEVVNFSRSQKLALWKSTGMSHESIEPPNKGFVPKWLADYSPYRVKFNENCLKQDSVSFVHKIMVNVYIAYELDTCSRDLN